MKSAGESMREIHITQAGEAEQETFLSMVDRLSRELEERPEESQEVDPVKVVAGCRLVNLSVCVLPLEGLCGQFGEKHVAGVLMNIKRIIPFPPE